MERLKIVENTLDGFEISQKDLEIRGEGEKFGTNQSGIDNHRKVANLISHEHLLLNAREDLESLIKDENLLILNQIKSFGRRN